MNKLYGVVTRPWCGGWACTLIRETPPMLDVVGGLLNRLVGVYDQASCHQWACALLWNTGEQTGCIQLKTCAAGTGSVLLLQLIAQPLPTSNEHSPCLFETFVPPPPPLGRPCYALSEGMGNKQPQQWGAKYQHCRPSRRTAKLLLL